MNEHDSDAAQPGYPSQELSQKREPESSIRYPATRIHSPMTSSVVATLREIRHQGESRQERVFMKIGSSETASRLYLRCFWGDERSPWMIDLGDHSYLRETLEFFQEGSCRGRQNSFLRDSFAAKVGKQAIWAYSGNPSPLKQEIRAINPAWAVIAFGTNDIHLGESATQALQNYYRRLSNLVDQVISEGIVPIIMSPGPRTDIREATLWTPIYNVVTRAIAQVRRVPYVNLFLATTKLPHQGLVRDGIHGNAWNSGKRGLQPCVMTEKGLQHHYNIRNLLTLEALHRTLRATREQKTVIESAPLPAIVGHGSLQYPYEIDRLPFTHQSSTAESHNDAFDQYPGCEDDTVMTGPEHIYRWVVDEAQAVRIVLLSGRGVDVDVQLLREVASPEACVARHTRMVAGTVATGVYFIVVDSYSERRRGERPGTYLLAIIPCSESDADCSELLE